jgi:hypothetical protein
VLASAAPGGFWLTRCAGGFFLTSLYEPQVPRGRGPLRARGPLAHVTPAPRLRAPALPTSGVEVGTQGSPPDLPPGRPLGSKLAEPCSRSRGRSLMYRRTQLIRAAPKLSYRLRPTVGFCCCFVAKPLFFHALVCRPFALLVAPFFTSAVAPGAKLSRPRHHALGGTSLAPSPVHSFELANLQDDPKRPPLPVCFIVSADEAVPSQGPQGRRPRAGARPRSHRFGHAHQPGWCMHAVLVEGQRRATLPFAAPQC